MQTLHIIKIGGNITDHQEVLQDFLKDFTSISGPKILIHGGGKAATRLAGMLNIPQTMYRGRRITDAATLDVAVMVYAGLTGKNICASLQAFGCNAISLCGADADLARAEKRPAGEIDFGLVGDLLPDGINHKLLSGLLQAGLYPVIAPITHDGKGQLLNTNADRMASAVAMSMSQSYKTELSFCFEKAGVLTDSADDESVIESLSPDDYEKLKQNDQISDGMLPKLDNAFEALAGGVSSVRICHAGDILKPEKGTQISA